MPSDAPYIAVSQRVVRSAHGEQRDCLDQEWTVWLESLGYRCVPVPNRCASPGEFVRDLAPAGIILSGGNNLTLDVYDLAGAEPPGDAFASRDCTERALIDVAVERRIPLLGFCRGFQFLHAYFGGRLTPVGGTAPSHVGRDHRVSLVADGYRQLAGSESLVVNSFHDYGIPLGGVVEPLIPFALSVEDSLVEGCCHRSLPMAGVMWHPERGNPAAGFDRRLLESLFKGAAPSQPAAEMQETHD
jgi:putative glutamine amidotransferase